jgi:hypothetical protein
VKTNADQERLLAARNPNTPWKKSGGPYLSERQWGTVREDDSDGGNAWSYFSHDQLIYLYKYPQAACYPIVAPQSNS